MKKLLFIILAVLASFISGCAKKEGCTDKNATNYNPAAKKDDGSCKLKKSYTVTYKATGIVEDSSQYKFYYVIAGNTYSQTVTTASNFLDWQSLSFDAKEGDYVSVKCTPPGPAPAGHNNSLNVFVTVNNGAAIFVASSKWPSTADAHGVLP